MIGYLNDASGNDKQIYIEIDNYDIGFHTRLSVYKASSFLKHLKEMDFGIKGTSRIMDYQKILLTAKERWGMQYPNIIAEVEARIRAGSTGGEIVASVGKLLKDLKTNNGNAYNLMAEEIDLYLKECELAGLKIK